MAEPAYLGRADDGNVCDMGGSQDALVQELYRVEGKAEIVGGRVVRMSAAGGLHGYAAGVIYARLLDYARRTRRGVALPDNVGFIVNLPHRRSFSPDAAFWTGPPLTRAFPEGAPVFAVEVRSPEDYGPAAERKLAEKRVDYFAAGTQAVWDVDLERATIGLHLADAPGETLFHRADMAHAEPVLPGWSMRVEEIVPSD